jgi:hypothetical protein
MYSQEPPKRVKKPNTAGWLPVWRWKSSVELEPVSPV